MSVATVHDLIDQQESNARVREKSVRLSIAFLCAALKVSTHHLFLQPSVAGTHTAPPLSVGPLRLFGAK